MPTKYFLSTTGESSDQKSIKNRSFGVRQGVQSIKHQSSIDLLECDRGCKRSKIDQSSQKSMRAPCVNKWEQAVFGMREEEHSIQQMVTKCFLSATGGSSDQKSIFWSATGSSSDQKSIRNQSNSLVCQLKVDSSNCQQMVTSGFLRATGGAFNR